MSTKLTLSIDKDIIEKAKIYAKEQGRSLSNIIEEYLKSISSQSQIDKDEELSDILKELKGSVKAPKDLESYDEIIQEALIDKYTDK